MDVTLSSGDLLALRRALGSGQLSKINSHQAVVRLQFEDGSQYPHDGRLEFSEVQVDKAPVALPCGRSSPTPKEFYCPGCLFTPANSNRQMVPFSAFGSGEWSCGSPRYERFNGVSAVNIQGSPAAGYSSGPVTYQQYEGNLAVSSWELLNAGLPSQVLTRRPDIMAAEHTLKAANTNIGAARAAFFPTISLTASAGSASSGLSELFDAGTGAWSFAPAISLPIFDGGKNQANLDVAKIASRIEVADYEKAVQQAFSEVAEALAGRETYASEVTARQQDVEASEKYYNIARLRYDAGTDDYLQVLTAQRPPGVYRYPVGVVKSEG